MAWAALDELADDRPAHRKFAPRRPSHELLAENVRGIAQAKGVSFVFLACVAGISGGYLAFGLTRGVCIGRRTVIWKIQSHMPPKKGTRCWRRPFRQQLAVLVVHLRVVGQALFGENVQTRLD
jgi:hypothetical protein